MENNNGASNPLQVGDTHIITITDVAFGGEGVGRIGDVVVFVFFVIFGEEVRVELTEVKKNFARARLLEILKPSDSRTRPQCPYFGDCGGCQYQHISYSTQLVIKHKQISDIFRRVGKFENVQVDPVIPCPVEYGYRNRIMIRSQWNKFKQGLEIGFIRYDNRLVIDVEHCPISEDEINEQIKYVRTHPPPKGGIKIVLRKLPAGWEVPHDSFFQNNFFLLPQLITAARQALTRSGTRYLVDVYCGVGFFGIELANSVEAFAGIEYDKKAIFAARRNAENRGIKNGEFFIGQAENILEGIVTRFSGEATTVLLDPPRTGVPVLSLDFLKKVRPRQIVYISCHPATLARDLHHLCSDGTYRLVRVTPLDMFPQTGHVECVTDLELVHESQPAA